MTSPTGALPATRRLGRGNPDKVGPQGASVTHQDSGTKPIAQRFTQDVRGERFLQHDGATRS